MFPGFLLSLREGLEAALIIGIVLGVLRKIGRNDLRASVWAGAACAGILSIITALILYQVGITLEGAAEVIFEGVTMLLAAAILTWMIFWMHHQSRSIKGSFEAGVRRAMVRGGKQALFSLAFLAILREGIELALFLTAATFASDALLTLVGAALGVTTSAILGWLMFATTVRLNLRLFFQVTGAILILFAAGLVAHGVHELNEVGWIPAVVEHIWDSNHLIDEESTFGLILKALFGYNGNPSLSEFIAYIGYFVAIWFGLRIQRGRTEVVQTAA